MKHNEELSLLLKTARGQLDGILKMLEEERYCIDIAHQIMAAQAILKKANQQLLSSHLQQCVRLAEQKEDREKKIKEIEEILKRIM